MLFRALPLLLFAAALFAQSPKYELRGAIGSTSFLDDSSQNHLLLAPSARYYFVPRVAVEVEFQYLRQNSSHHDVVFLPSLVYDFREGRFVPYISAGLGVVRSSFARFSETEAFVQAGVGLKIYLNQNWYVAPELKFGWEPHARVAGVVGYSWGR